MRNFMVLGFIVFPVWWQRWIINRKNSTHKQLKVVTDAMWAANSVHGYRLGRFPESRKRRF